MEPAEPDLGGGAMAPQRAFKVAGASLSTPMILTDLEDEDTAELNQFPSMMQHQQQQHQHQQHQQQQQQHQQQSRQPRRSPAHPMGRPLSAPSAAPPPLQPPPPNPSAPAPRPAPLTRTPSMRSHHSQMQMPPMQMPPMPPQGQQGRPPVDEKTFPDDAINEVLFVDPADHNSMQYMDHQSAHSNVDTSFHNQDFGPPPPPPQQRQPSPLLQQPSQQRPNMDFPLEHHPTQDEDNDIMAFSSPRDRPGIEDDFPAHDEWDDGDYIDEKDENNAARRICILLSCLVGLVVLVVATVLYLLRRGGDPIGVLLPATVGPTRAPPILPPTNDPAVFRSPAPTTPISTGAPSKVTIPDTTVPATTVPATPAPSPQPTPTPRPTLSPTAAPIDTMLPTRSPETMVPTPLPSSSPTTLAPSPSPTQTTTLQIVFNRGFLRCGVPPNQDGFNTVDPFSRENQGFEVDLCKAIAAAIFGTSSGTVQFVDATSANRFQLLQDGGVDVLARLTTHNMERDVFEPSAQAGFTFSTPYLYNGLGFGGDPLFTFCADELDVVTANCTGLRICVLDSTTHVGILSSLFPAPLVASPSVSSMLNTFAGGFCNVIAGEQFDIAESVVRDATGYTGDYAVAPNVLSKEPICLVTREGDPRWSDFVNWVLVGLMRAEERNVGQLVAGNFGLSPPVFGQNYISMFVRAIAEVGNYGEIYARHLESIVPRESVNTINTGNTGLIYSFPYGELQVNGTGPTPGGTIELIKSRGFLRCGIKSQLGFGVFDTGTQTYSGFDVDYCRAVSAALFDGIDSTVEYVLTSASERFTALANGDVDLLCRTTTATFDRDVLEPSTGEGFTFAQTTFYDGLAFGGIPPYGECADTLGSFGACSDLKICVEEDTTTIVRVKELFPGRFLVPVSTNLEKFQGLKSGLCNAVAGDSTNVLQESAITLGQYTGPYEVGTRRFSKEPLTPVTRQDDDQWSDFVYWVVSSTFYAEEEGITRATSDRMPTSGLFGPQFSQSLINAIGAVGNYGEIYTRSLEGLVTRGGANDLNLSPFGPQIFVRPGI